MRKRSRDRLRSAADVLYECGMTMVVATPGRMLELKRRWASPQGPSRSRNRTTMLSKAGVGALKG